MREILFRGKRTDYSEWLYGQLIIDNDKAHHIYVFKQDILGDVISGLRYVNEDTVGQYTGLKDKNGTKIFEGDICVHSDKENYPRPLAVEWIEECACFAFVDKLDFDKKYYFQDIDMKHIKVIGNTYNNKNLLK